MYSLIISFIAANCVLTIFNKDNLFYSILLSRSTACCSSLLAEHLYLFYVKKTHSRPYAVCV